VLGLEQCNERSEAVREESCEELPEEFCLKSCLKSCRRSSRTRGFYAESSEESPKESHEARSGLHLTLAHLVGIVRVPELDECVMSHLEIVSAGHVCVTVECGFRAWRCINIDQDSGSGSSIYSRLGRLEMFFLKTILMWWSEL